LAARLRQHPLWELKRSNRPKKRSNRPILRLRNDLYCVEWGVKLYSLTPNRPIAAITGAISKGAQGKRGEKTEGKGRKGGRKRRGREERGEKRGGAGAPIMTPYDWFARRPRRREHANQISSKISANKKQTNAKYTTNTHRNNAQLTDTRSF